MSVEAFDEQRAFELLEPSGPRRLERALGLLTMILANAAGAELDLTACTMSAMIDEREDDPDGGSEG